MAETKAQGPILARDSSEEAKVASDRSTSPSTASDRHNSDIEKHASAQSEAAGVPWTFTRCVAIVSLCLVYTGAQGILYFTGGALGFIAKDINTDVPNWLLTANTLAVTAICPFVGYITDLLGRRYVAIFGSLCLIVGSVVQCTSSTLGSSITAQTIGGFGAGICELTALAGVAEITPVRWRGLILSLVTASIEPFMFYLLYVEELQAHSTWRWAVGIVAIWNGIGAIGVILCYHPPARHNVDGMTKSAILRGIDWGGAFLSIAGVTLFLVGLQYGGYSAPWTSGEALAPLIIGVLLLIAFPFYEMKVPAKPMIPSAIFKGQNVVGVAFLVVFIAGMVFYSILGFFPLMLQQLYLASPLLTGLRGITYTHAILSAACIMNALLSFTRGHIREIFIAMGVLMTVFTAALVTATPFNVGQTIAFAVLGSFGVGGIIVPALTVALYACPDAYIGTTAALSLTFRFLGGSIGTTIYYNIFNTKFKAKVVEYVVPAVTAAGLPADQAATFVKAIAADTAGSMAMMIPGVNTAIVEAGSLQARWALADSLAYVWYTTIPFGIIAIIACCFLPNIKKYMTNRVAVDLH